MDNVWAQFFPIFLEKEPLKVNKILKLTFLQARKDFDGFKPVFFHLSFVVDALFTTPIYSPRRGCFVNKAFPNKKNLAKNKVYFWQTNLKANVCKNSTFQVNTRKNATWRRCLTLSNQINISVSTSCEERHNKPFRL